MQFSGAKAVLLLAAICIAPADANPLAKVIDMIDALTAKVVKEGEAEEAAYVKFFEWCDDAAKNAQNEIANAKTKKADLEAKIGKLTADIADSTEKIDGLVASIAKDSKELEGATDVRNKEAADFAKEEGELEEGVDTLGRAIAIIERDMSKNPAAFAQVDSSNNGVLKALSTVLDAASFSNADQQRLTALVQARQGDEDEDTGAPAGDTYKTHSGGILEVLQDMKEKAEDELSSLRKAETSAKNNYDMLKQSLEDSMAADNKDKSDEQEVMSTNSEEKAAAEGELTETDKTLKDGNSDLQTVQGDCMTTAADHATSKAGRAEELKVIADAKKILEDSTGGASAQTYSFIEISSSKDLENREVVAIVQKLAKDHKSAALTQLASKIKTVLKFGSSAGGFGKIKDLITDMIAKLEKEAEEAGTEKAYCDEQMSKTEAKKVDLDDTIARLTSKIDKSKARSAGLKEDVKTLQEELAALATEQAEMDKIRKEQNAAYVEAKADLDAGLSGVRKALEMLRGYYGGSASMLQSGAAFTMQRQPKMPEYHSGAGGAGNGIISMLEVVESDFAKNLASEEKEEADAAEEYEKVTQENAVSKTDKDADVKYKQQEFTALDKSVADLGSDRDTANSELSAVMEYYDKVKDRCIAKPESYAEIKARRDAEIKGLKDALNILEGEGVFMQRRKHGLRGAFLG